jgi:hypothetical protein
MATCRCLGNQVRYIVLHVDNGDGSEYSNTYGKADKHSSTLVNAYNTADAHAFTYAIRDADPPPDVNAVGDADPSTEFDTNSPPDLYADRNGYPHPNPDTYGDIGTDRHGDAAPQTYTNANPHQHTNPDGNFDGYAGGDLDADGYLFANYGPVVRPWRPQRPFRARRQASGRWRCGFASVSLQAERRKGRRRQPHAKPVAHFTTACQVPASPTDCRLLRSSAAFVVFCRGFELPRGS